MDLKKSFIFSNSIPKVEEYLNLRNNVEWTSPPKNYCEKGINNSNYFLSVRKEGKLIGMGRIIGDGVCTFHIVDIIVVKEFQGIGLGKEIMLNIMNHINEIKAPNSYISLMAAKGKEEFYKKFGFYSRPTEDVGPGMMIDFIN